MTDERIKNSQKDERAKKLFTSQTHDNQPGKYTLNGIVPAPQRTNRRTTHGRTGGRAVHLGTRRAA